MLSVRPRLVRPRVLDHAVNPTPSKVNITVEGRSLEQVESYVYLGQLITEEGRCDKEIRRRIEIARKEFINMKSILTSRKLSIETRKSLIRCYVLSTFLYTAETWTIDKENWKRIEASEMWLSRRMMKISYEEHVSNEEVLRRTSSKRSLKKTIMKRKLAYFGHVVRAEKLQRQLMDGRVEGERGRGRPRITWVTDITEATKQRYSTCVRTAQSARGGSGCSISLMVMGTVPLPQWNPSPEDCYFYIGH